MVTEGGRDPGVSVVVVNYNGGSRLCSCLEALETQDPAPTEIIVVDSASDDGSPALVRERFPRARLDVLSENRGPSPARNRGLELARNELVLLVDHDVYLEPGGLMRLLTRYAARSAGDRSTIVCPRIVYFPDGTVVQCDGAEPHCVGTLVLRNEGSERSAIDDAWRTVGGCLSASLLVPRTPVLQAGGFDEDYFLYFEDLEFSLRLRSRGFEFVCEPTAVARHDRGVGVLGLSYRGSGPYPRRRFYLTMRNRLMTILLHYRIRTLVVLSPVMALYELATLVAAVSRGWLLDWIRAWFWQTANLGSLFDRRKACARRRLVPDRELLVGGPMPLARGFVRSRAAQRAVSWLSAAVDGYWRLARRWVG